MAGIIQNHSIVKSINPQHDPQGSNPKPRRFVVLRLIPGSTAFIGIGISSSYDRANPNHVKIPANHKTGLSLDSAAICDDWLTLLELQDVERIGHCPVKEIRRIQEVVKRLS